MNLSREQLELHRKWVENEQGGVRLALAGADLTEADLRGSSLRGADLTGTYL